MTPYDIRHDPRSHATPRYFFNAHLANAGILRQLVRVALHRQSRWQRVRYLMRLGGHNHANEDMGECLSRSKALSTDRSLGSETVMTCE